MAAKLNANRRAAAGGDKILSRDSFFFFGFLVGQTVWLDTQVEELGIPTWSILGKEKGTVENHRGSLSEGKKKEKNITV